MLLKIPHNSNGSDFFLDNGKSQTHVRYTPPRHFQDAHYQEKIPAPLNYKLGWIQLVRLACFRRHSVPGIPLRKSLMNAVCSSQFIGFQIREKPVASNAKITLDLYVMYAAINAESHQILLNLRHRDFAGFATTLNYNENTVVLSHTGKEKILYLKVLVPLLSGHEVELN
uniref:Uncharacterized protein n=1 Tax=Glossina austeni TaxID=7395 RepID=A0A1A9V8F9_GLOAU